MGMDIVSLFLDGGTGWHWSCGAAGRAEWRLVNRDLPQLTGMGFCFVCFRLQSVR